MMSQPTPKISNKSMMSQPTPKITNKSQRPGTADSGNQRPKKRHNNISSSQDISGPGDFLKSGVCNMKWDTLGGTCTLRHFTIQDFYKAVKQADVPILVDIHAKIIHLSGYSTSSLLKLTIDINENQIIFDEYSKINVGKQECERQCGILMNCIEQVPIPNTQMGEKGCIFYSKRGRKESSRHKYLLKNASWNLRSKFKGESQTLIENHRNEKKLMEPPNRIKDIFQNTINGLLTSLPLSDGNHDPLAKKSLCQNSYFNCGILTKSPTVQAIKSHPVSSTKSQSIKQSPYNDQSPSIKPSPSNVPSFSPSNELGSEDPGNIKQSPCNDQSQSTSNTLGSEDPADMKQSPSNEPSSSPSVSPLTSHDLPSLRIGNQFIHVIPVNNHTADYFSAIVVGIGKKYNQNDHLILYHDGTGEVMDCVSAVNQTWSDEGWDFEDLSPPEFSNTYWGNLVWVKWRSKKYLCLVLPDSCESLTEDIKQRFKKEYREWSGKKKKNVNKEPFIVVFLSFKSDFTTVTADMINIISDESQLVAEMFYKEEAYKQAVKQIEAGVKLSQETVNMLYQTSMGVLFCTLSNQDRVRKYCQWQRILREQHEESIRIPTKYPDTESDSDDTDSDDSSKAESDRMTDDNECEYPTSQHDSETSSEAESDTITDNNECESSSSQHDDRNFRLYDLVVKVTLYDRDGKLIAPKKSISVRLGNENYLPPLERAKLFKEWIKSHNSKVRNGEKEVLNMEQWIVDEAVYFNDPLYSKDGIEKELEEKIDELREYLCNNNVILFLMKPVSGLRLLRHGFIRVKRSDRWFVHVSPAEELFVYDHKKFLENSKYKEYFEEQEEDVKNHITEECDGRKCIISEYLLRMLFSDEDVNKFARAPHLNREENKKLAHGRKSFTHHVYFTADIPRNLIKICYKSSHKAYYHPARCDKMYGYLIKQRKYRDMLDSVGDCEKHKHLGKALMAMPVEERIIQVRNGNDHTKAEYIRDMEFAGRNMG
eukprot:scaffold31170_cov69-Cyclotella_meneghiniana.AAC.5